MSPNVIPTRSYMYPKMPTKFFNIMWGIESVLWLRIDLSGEEPLTTHLLGENPELVSEFNPLREQE